MMKQVLIDNVKISFKIEDENSDFTSAEITLCPTGANTITSRDFPLYIIKNTNVNTIMTDIRTAIDKFKPILSND